MKLVCFIHFRTRGCGCSEHPAFPAPSLTRREVIREQLGRNSRRGIAESYALLLFDISIGECAQADGTPDFPYIASARFSNAAAKRPNAASNTEPIKSASIRLLNS